MRAPTRLDAWIIMLSSLCLSGCENGMRNMYDQAKHKPLAASPLWEDGRASRPLLPDTIIHSAGTLAGTASGRESMTRDEPAEPRTYTRAALERGRERFGIYCAPCHGPAGDGNGYITERGFPHPPTYHSDRLRQAPDRYLFEVITRGYGAMYPYADRVTAADRWSIVAYIRALQRSQHARISDVPESERQRLATEP